MGLLCPYCNSDHCRRSHRRGFTDYLYTFARLRPWRCRVCEERFYAWSVPVAYFRYAHCGRCGNFDLRRHVSHDHVREGLLRWPMRLLGAHAYRCDPCRFCFFSFRKYRKIVPVPYEPPVRQTPGQAFPGEPVNS